jgi:GT2 family glycosyltransferase
MSNPLVTIISINYKQASVTCEMLASLQAITYPNYEVIVVDNASPEDEITPVENSFPDVQLIRSSQNLGFAGGNNLGIAAAKGKYLLFLNNDTEVAPGFLEPLVEVFEANTTVGVASPKIIFHGTDNLIQYAGCAGINPWTGRSITFGSLEKDEGQHDVSSSTALAHGAAMMVPMELVKRVGLMPELYFLYYEELDWCEMFKRAGYYCHYVAKSTVYHKESASVGQGSIMRTYYMYRNRLLYIRRNLKGVQFWSGVLFFLLLAVPKQAMVFALRAQFKYLQALWRGLKWHLKPHNIHQNHFLT